MAAPTILVTGRAVLGVDVRPSPFTDRVGSICDKSFIEECMTGARSVGHAASLHKPHIAIHSQRDFIDTNVTGTLVLLELGWTPKYDFAHGLNRLRSVQDFRRSLARQVGGTGNHAGGES